MLPSFTEKYDVVVVGAGHAGCEAAAGAARMGLKTALYTINLDLIAHRGDLEVLVRLERFGDRLNAIEVDVHGNLHSGIVVPDDGLEDFDDALIGRLFDLPNVREL